MPANLPPDYFAAEERFRAARTPEDKIVALEEMLAVMPKHKGTDKLKAMLRERISKFRAQALERNLPPGSNMPASGVRVSVTVRWCRETMSCRTAILWSSASDAPHLPLPITGAASGINRKYATFALEIRRI